MDEHYELRGSEALIDLALIERPNDSGLSANIGGEFPLHTSSSRQAVVGILPWSMQTRYLESYIVTSSRIDTVVSPDVRLRRTKVLLSS
jgi:hypothetical protein